MILVTAGLYDLPDSWTWATISEIGNVITGTTPPKACRAFYGPNYPFFKPTDLNTGYCTRDSSDHLSPLGMKQARLLPEKAILVTCIGATIGKTGLIRTAEACNQQINAIIAHNGILPEFVYFWCISGAFQKQINTNASATTLPILNKGKFEQLSIPLAPLNEQNRIVEKIEELFSFLDAGIALLHAVQAQLKRYRQALLKQAFCAEGNDIFPFGNVVESYQNGLSKRRSDEGEPIKVLRLADIEDGAITAKAPRVIKLITEEKQKYSLNKNDLLCIRVNGSKSNTGQLVVFTEKEPWAFCDHLIRIRLKKGIEPQYVKQYFDSPIARRYVESSIISSAGQNTISQGSLSKIPFPFIDAPKQKAIVDYVQTTLSIIKNNEQTIEQSLWQSFSLRQSILNQAFKGKLVPHNTADKTANELLERINAKRLSNISKNNREELSEYVK